jgi:hypothetical protein
MRDYNFIDEAGGSTPVSSMSTSLILELIQDGFLIDERDGMIPKSEDVLERLRIELTARSLGLASIQ